MFQFNTVEEALEELRNGRVILVTDDPTAKMRVILSVRRSLLRQRILILWRRMAKD